MKAYQKFLAAVGSAVLLFTAAACYCRHSFPTPYYAVIQRECANHGVRPALVYAIIKAESNFNAQAVSRRGAVGLMQLMPQTAEFMARRQKICFLSGLLYQPEYNITLGVAYVGYLSGRFSDVKTVIAAYNAGEGRVSLWLQDEDVSSDGISLKRIPYSETQKYAKKVLKFYKIYEKMLDITKYNVL